MPALASPRLAMPARPLLITASLASIVVGRLDLLRMLGLDPAAYPHGRPASLGKSSPAGEIRIASLPDRNRKALRPMPSEIHLWDGSALRYGRHLALDQRKAASLREHVRRFVGPDRLIIRIGPQAKLGFTRATFAAGFHAKTEMYRDCGAMLRARQPCRCVRSKQDSANGDRVFCRRCALDCFRNCS